MELEAWQEKLEEFETKLEGLLDFENHDETDPVSREILLCREQVRECQKKIERIESDISECRNDLSTTLVTLLQCKTQLEITLHELNLSLDKLKELESHLQFEKNVYEHYGFFYKVVVSVKNMLFRNPTSPKNSDDYSRLIHFCKVMIENLNKTVTSCCEEVKELEKIITLQREMNARHDVKTDSLKRNFEQSSAAVQDLNFKDSPKQRPPLPTILPRSRSSRLPSDNELKLSLPNSYRRLLPKASEWENIGIFLHVPDSVLNTIKYDCHSDSRDCMREMLREWLKQVDPTPSWEALADAVEDIDSHLAEEIRKEYCVQSLY